MVPYRSDRRIFFLLISMFFVALLIYPPLTIKVAGREQSGVKGGGNKISDLKISQLPSKEKRWALIVGIDKYEKDVSTLEGAVNDAEALKDVLIKYAGFPSNQIILLTSDAPDPGDRPKRENILGALNELSTKMQPDGLFLFSFSGHGIAVGNEAFLIPSNGRITKNLSLLKGLSINVLDIKAARGSMANGALSVKPVRK